jgi:hypothetical protein
VSSLALPSHDQRVDGWQPREGRRPRFLEARSPAATGGSDQPDEFEVVGPPLLEARIQLGATGLQAVIRHRAERRDWLRGADSERMATGFETRSPLPASLTRVVASASAPARGPRPRFEGRLRWPLRRGVEQTGSPDRCRSPRPGAERARAAARYPRRTSQSSEPCRAGGPVPPRCPDARPVRISGHDPGATCRSLTRRSAKRGVKRRCRKAAPAVRRGRSRGAPATVLPSCHPARAGGAGGRDRPAGGPNLGRPWSTLRSRPP